MTTLGQALAAVRARIDEQTATAWTDAEIRGWVNEAVIDIARRTETVEKSTTKNLTANVQEYTSLPADLQRIHRVEYVSPGSGSQVTRLELCQLNDLDPIWWGGKKQNYGRPAFCALSGYPPNLTLTLTPIPTETGASLKIWYYASPAALATNGTADSSTLEVPLGWEDLVYDYATHLALLRDGQEAWTVARQAYESKISDMLDRTRFWHDQPGFIQPSNYPLVDWDYSYGGGW